VSAEEPIPSRREVEAGRYLLEYEALPSTQDVARQIAKQGAGDVVGVRASYQSQGRGRRGTAWTAPPESCLLITYILTPFHARDAARLSFAAGVAVARTISELCDIEAKVKWPNDLLIGGRKAGGILIDTSGESALVGIGLNANVNAFPPDLQSGATSLLIETGREWSIVDLEALLRSHLLRLSVEPWSNVLPLWRQVDDTAGRKYRVLDGSDREGIAVGVDQDGALLIQHPDGSTTAELSATSS
jgi:BirA family biotin operon repressor/biotin-[acetyl-CoA-carboxylase] ligase